MADHPWNSVRNGVILGINHVDLRQKNAGRTQGGDRLQLGDGPRDSADGYCYSRIGEFEVLRMKRLLFLSLLFLAGCKKSPSIVDISLVEWDTAVMLPRLARKGEHIKVTKVDMSTAAITVGFIHDDRLEGNEISLHAPAESVEVEFDGKVWKLVRPRKP